MQISAETLNILENFSTINPNLVINPGNVISTVNEPKSVMASASTAESFPETVGIYDLGNFLSALKLVEKADLEFTTTAININGVDTSLMYRCASASNLTTPKKQVTMPETELTVELSSVVLDRLRVACSTLKYDVVELNGENGVVTAVVTATVSDPTATNTANAFRIVLDKNNACKSKFSFQFKLGNLKLIDADYTVKVSSKLVSNWVAKNRAIQYWIALEKTSSYVAN